MKFIIRYDWLCCVNRLFNKCYDKCKTKSANGDKNIAGIYVSANVTNISGVTVLSINVLGSENPMSGIVVDFMILGSFNH